MSRVLFGPEQLQERGHDAFRLAGVPAAVGDDRVLHRGRVQHFHGAQRLARKLASYSRARKKCDAKVALDHLFGRLDGVELHQAAEAHSGRKKRSLRDLVVAGRAVEHDQLLRGHLGHRDVGELGERMIWRAHQDQVLGVEGAQLQVWVPDGTPKADLDFVAQDQGRAELALEALKACGQRRLGDEEGLGGPADAAPPGDLEEALDLDELDATWLPVTGFFYGHGRTLQILSMATPTPTSWSGLTHEWGRVSSGSLAAGRGPPPRRRSTPVPS